VRAASADILVRLIPPKLLSLEQAIEFLREDECVEIAPDVVRLRKQELTATERVKTARKAKRAEES
jgi:predicted membrane GTPase involved in stress response